jgi:hypothetical protein
MAIGFDDPYLGIAAGYLANRGGGRSPLQALGAGMLQAQQMQAMQAQQAQRQKQIDLQTQQAEQALKQAEKRQKVGEKLAEVAASKHGPEVAGTVQMLANEGKINEAVQAAYYGIQSEQRPPPIVEVTQGHEVSEQQWNPAEGRYIEVGRGPRVAGAGTVIQTTPEGGFMYTSGGPVGARASVVQPLSKPQQNKMQESVIGLADSLGRLDQITNDFDPEFLTSMGRLKRQGLRIQDYLRGPLPKLGEADTKWLKQYRRFAQGVNREFFMFRKMITGAAATMSELETLKEGIINMDLPPTEFEAAMDQYKGELKRTRRLHNKLLREGLEVGSEEFGNRMDMEFLSYADDAVQDRGPELEQQLRAEGLEGQALVDKIQEIMTAEGYI